MATRAPEQQFLEPSPPAVSRAHAATMLPPLELPDDILDNILLRIPPGDRAFFLRASLVCKRWRRVLADPAFRRARIALHRRQPFLGFLHVVTKHMPFCSRFVPSDPSSHCPAARDLPGWLVLDCRHGRALFGTAGERVPGNLGSPDDQTLDFIVWDPLTGEEHRLPRPPSSHSFSRWYFDTPCLSTLGRTWNAVVLCAVAGKGCDHSNCHGGPFIVVFIINPYSWRSSALICLYSSKTGKWRKQSAHQPYDIIVGSDPIALVEDTLYFNCRPTHIFKYQLGTQRLSVINMPLFSVPRVRSGFPMIMEDGRFIFIGMESAPKSSARLCLFSREKGLDGVARWAQIRATELEMFLPDGALPCNPDVLVDFEVNCPISVKVVGFVDGTDVCFVGVRARESAVYKVELNSGRASKVLDCCTYVFPYTICSSN